MVSFYKYFKDVVIAGGISQGEAKSILGISEPYEGGVVGYTYLDSLVKNGFFEPQEAKKYKKAPTALPKDKKGLIASYTLFSKAVNNIDSVLNGEFMEFISEYIKELNIPRSEMEALANEDKKIEEVLGEEGTIAFYKKMQDKVVASITEKVSSFVLEKRRRLREEIKKALLLRMVYALSSEPDTLDSIAYLREMAKENGYREDADSLNEKDKQALSLCADYYLDLLELLSITGEGAKREEVYKGLWDENFTLKEEYHYKDVEDEALMEFFDIYDLQNTLYSLALSTSTTDTKDHRPGDLAKLINAKCFTPEELVGEKLQNTKFKEYVLDLYEINDLKELLSPETYRKLEEYLQGEPQH